MKKIILCLFLLLGLFVFPNDTYAASVNSSLSGSTTVTVGSTVKVTASVSGKRIYIMKGTVSSDNSAVLSGGGMLYKKIDLMENENGFNSYSKTFTFTAKSVGTATITFSDDGKGLSVDDVPLSFSTKTLTIKVVEKKADKPTPSKPSGGTTTVKPSNPKPVEDNRSKENELSSLTISQGKLSPDFNPSKTTYNVDLAGNIKELDISAKAKDSKAKVLGTGTKQLSVGDNSFKVVCTAENGSKKTYTINVHVDEAPLVYTKLDDKNLGVVRILEGVKAPNGFSLATFKLDGQDIQGYKNDQLNMTVAYLIDESGNKDFYIVEDEKVVSLFKPLTINSRLYYSVSVPSDLKGLEGLKASKVKIGDIELDGWVFEDEAHKNYSVVYLMNNEGVKQLYSYEAGEGTLQIYTPFVQEDSSLDTMTIIFMGTTALASVLAITGFVMYFNFKKKSISAIREYYQRRNQE